MDYKLLDLIDLDVFKNSINSLYEVIDLPFGLYDSDSQFIYGVGYKDICLNFHKKNMSSCNSCYSSDSIGIQDSNKKTYAIHKCPNGLYVAFVSIKVENIPIGYVAIGQFLFEDPDLSYFENQAQKYNYDVKKYLKAVSEVIILTKEDFEKKIKLFISISKQMEYVAENQLKNIRREKTILQLNKTLEKRIAIKTQELVETNLILRKNEKNQRTLLENLPYGVIVRYGTKILYANKYSAKLMSLATPVELMGKDIFDFIKPHPKYAEDIKEFITYGDNNEYSPSRIEYFYRIIDSKLLKLNITGTATTFNGKKAVLVSFNEITTKEALDKLNKTVEEKERQLKYAIEYDKLKTEFFSNMSHELKTPINVIYSALQVINSQIENIDSSNSSGYVNTMKYLHVMRQNCMRLIRLVNNILDVSKLESGYCKLDFCNCNIVEVVENITLSVVDYIESTGIELLFDTNTEEQIIACDPENIERIILNLLSNAVKFTDKDGKITVTLTIDAEYVFISILDTGKGIPIEKQKNIFDRFVQIDKSLSRNHEGSGIGLSLVKALVEAHDGKISLNSEVGIGSEFIIKLPIKKINNKPLCSDNENYNGNSQIERVHIEFSDIYM